MNIEIDDYVKADIRDGEFRLLQVKSINGDRAVCADYLNEVQVFNLSISKLIKANDPTDTKF
jgi:hypothetical protein